MNLKRSVVFAGGAAVVAALVMPSPISTRSPIAVLFADSLNCNLSQYKAAPGLSAAIEQSRTSAEADGHTVVAVALDGEPAGLLVVADRVKPSSAEAISELSGLGLAPVLLTGDNERTAAKIAREVGIERVVADVLPEEKAEEWAGEWLAEVREKVPATA